MSGEAGDRHLIVRSRLAEGYQLTELGQKQLQHVFTVWFPRTVFYDLTADTARVDVVVRHGRTSGKNVYATTFLRADGAVLKTLDYDEDRLSGRVCEHYDQMRSGYCGKKDGYDYRMVRYSAAPVTVISRPR
ncbi:MAG: hypothetical protein IT529_15055 [Burkholderiales bacterium]|nr:hypothetical protein [Burkholderiales bacterium]